MLLLTFYHICQSMNCNCLSILILINNILGIVLLYVNGTLLFKMKYTMTIEELNAQINFVNTKLANEKNPETRNKLINQLKVLNLKKEIDTIKQQIQQLSI
jgi:hypothetical protein